MAVCENVTVPKPVRKSVELVIVYINKEAPAEQLAEKHAGSWKKIQGLHGETLFEVEYPPNGNNRNTDKPLPIAA